jgi:hypothetical protein
MRRGWSALSFVALSAAALKTSLSHGLRLVLSPRGFAALVRGANRSDARNRRQSIDRLVGLRLVEQPLLRSVAQWCQCVELVVQELGELAVRRRQFRQPLGSSLRFEHRARRRRDPTRPVDRLQAILETSHVLSQQAMASYRLAQSAHLAHGFVDRRVERSSSKILRQPPRVARVALAARPLRRLTTHRLRRERAHHLVIHALAVPSSKHTCLIPSIASSVVVNASLVVSMTLDSSLFPSESTTATVVLCA